MAVDSPLLHDGAILFGFDARNSTLSGTTNAGPSGSAQFTPVVLSTVTAFMVLPASSGGRAYGILQNKGSSSQAADVAIVGICKAVCVSSFGIGVQLSVSTALSAGSTASVGIGPYSSAAGIYPIGIARESAVPGQVFSMALYGFGAGSGGL